MDDLAYLGVILFGAATLVVEATRQFSIPTTLESHDNYPTLRGLELGTLSTRNEYLRGYLFYVLFYLGTYAAFLGSTELYQLLEVAAQRLDTIGPTGSFHVADQEVSLDSGKYAKPLFISTTIVLALSMGVVSKIESWIRNFSHRLAGIPRGVYRIITQLSKLDYKSIGNAAHFPKLVQFDENVSQMQEGAYDQTDIDNIRQDLKILCVLSHGLIDSFSEKFWPYESLNIFSKLIDHQKKINDQVDLAIENLSSGASAVQFLAETTHEAKNSALALFSLLYIRNFNIGIPGEISPTARVIIELRREKVDPIIQSIFGALMFSFFLTIIGYIAVDTIYYAYFDNPENLGLLAVLVRDISEVAHSAIWFSLRFVVLFAIAAFLAAAVRESHIEMGIWSPWLSRVTPYQKLISAAVLPSMLATVAFGLVFFIEYALVPFLQNGTIITTRHVLDFSRTHLPFIGLCFFLPFFGSLCVYIVANSHARLVWYKTLSIGVMFSFACLLWSMIAVIITYGHAPGDSGLETVIFSVKEAGFYFIASLVFFCSFALLVELTEEQVKDDA